MVGLAWGTPVQITNQIRYLMDDDSLVCGCSLLVLFYAFFVGSIMTSLTGSRDDFRSKIYVIK